MALQLTVFSEFGLFHSNYPYFFTFLTKKVITFQIFLKKSLRKFFLPKHSDFDCKLSEKSNFFGPMVLQKTVLSEFGLFHGAVKRRHFATTLMLKDSEKNFFHQNNVILIVN